MYRRNLLLTAFFLTALPAAASVLPVASIVNQVSQDQYAAFLNNNLYTHLGDSRYAPEYGPPGPQHDLARSNIFAAFAGLGLNPTLEAFTWKSATYYNVVGTLLGTTHPNQVYVAGAHYDSVRGPGANDNGSGVASVVEAARVLSQYRFEDTLKFVAFDLEEQGHFGSQAYVASQAGSDIRGMISVDMIGYDAAGANHDTVDLHYPNASRPGIVTALGGAIAQYGNGVSPVPAHDASLGLSDHEAFYLAGYDAVWVGEHNYPSDPNFHKVTDSVDTPNYINYAYATNTTRGVVGYLAAEANVVPEPNSISLSFVALVGILAYAWRKRNQGEGGVPSCDSSAIEHPMSFLSSVAVNK